MSFYCNQQASSFLNIVAVDLKLSLTTHSCYTCLYLQSDASATLDITDNGDGSFDYILFTDFKVGPNNQSK